MAYLIDTNIIIYSRKGSSIVNQWFSENKNIPMFISSITYAELLYCAYKSKNVEKNLIVVEKTCSLFNMVDINADVIRIFAREKSRLSLKGVTVDDMDILIAASALYMNLDLVTNNERHFKVFPDIVLVNPLAGA